MKGSESVGDEASLKDAISNPETKHIELTSGFEITEEAKFSNPITVDGNNNTVTTPNTGKIFNFTADAKLKDMNFVSMADNESWNSSYAVQFYTGNSVVRNCTFTGGNAAFIVNGANVTLKGTIDVSGNTFGGIEVCKGVSPDLNAGVLNIAGASIINTTEAYGKPTIWIDGNTDDDGIVVGAEDMTMIEVLHGDTIQKQYYLDPANAVNPNPPTVTIDCPDEFKAGVATEFSVTFTPGDQEGVMVQGTGGMTEGSDLVTKLEYKEGNKWIDMTGKDIFGASTGFPLQNATSTFRVTAEEGHIKFHIEMITADTKFVLASAEDETTVLNNDPSVLINMPDQINAGEATEFSVAFGPGRYEGTMVRGTGGITEGEDLVVKLEYQQGDQWIDMTGESFFGDSSGFPLQDAESHFRVTCKPGTIKFHIEMVTAEDNKVLANADSQTTVLDVPSQVTVDLPVVIQANTPVEFSVSTIAGSNIGTMVRGTGDFNDGKDLITKLEYKQGEEWIDMTGEDFFGASSGFPMANATSYFRVTAETGIISLAIQIVKVDGGEVIASANVGTTVA